MLLSKFLWPHWIAVSAKNCVPMGQGSTTFWLLVYSSLSLSESSLQVYRFLPREFSLFASPRLGHALVKMQNNQQAWLQLSQVHLSILFHCHSRNRKSLNEKVLCNHESETHGKPNIHRGWMNPHKFHRITISSTPFYVNLHELNNI